METVQVRIILPTTINNRRAKQSLTLKTNSILIYLYSVCTKLNNNNVGMMHPTSPSDSVDSVLDTPLSPPTPLSYATSYPYHHPSPAYHRKDELPPLVSPIIYRPAPQMPRSSYHEHPQHQQPYAPSLPSLKQSDYIYSRPVFPIEIKWTTLPTGWHTLPPLLYIVYQWFPLPLALPPRYVPPFLSFYYSLDPLLTYTCLCLLSLSLYAKLWLTRWSSLLHKHIHPNLLELPLELYKELYFTHWFNLCTAFKVDPTIGWECGVLKTWACPYML